MAHSLWWAMHITCTCSMCVCVCACVTFLVHCNNVASYFIYCGMINCSCSIILLVCHIGAFLIGGSTLVPHGVLWVDHSRSKYIVQQCREPTCFEWHYFTCSYTIGSSFFLLSVSLAWRKWNLSVPDTIGTANNMSQLKEARTCSRFAHFLI